MPKPQYQFYFADEPQYAGNSPRHVTANILRSYRRQPAMYELRRHGAGHYSVRVRGSDAIAVIARK